MRSRRRNRGFTIVELVTVIIVVGIMSAVVVPKLADRPFDQRGFRDSAAGAIQHARRMAIASRRFSCVTVTASSVAESRNATAPEAIAAPIACAVVLPLPAPASGCATNAVCAPEGVALSPTALIFDPLGRLVTGPNTVAAAAASITVSANGQPDMSITVQPETGYIQ